MFARIYKFLERLSPSTLVALLTGVTFGIGYFHYLAGTDTSFSAIYLLPIGTAAWFLKRPIAYALAILSSFLWVTGDVAAGAHYTSIMIPLWNLAARFATFVFVTQLISESLKLHDDLETLAVDVPQSSPPKLRCESGCSEIAANQRTQAGEQGRVG